MSEVRFCYRIAAEANVGHDIETGEPAEIYAKITLDVQQPIENYELAHQKIGNGIAADYKWDPSWVIPISEEEYYANVGPEEDNDYPSH